MLEAQGPVRGHHKLDRAGPALPKRDAEAAEWPGSPARYSVEDSPAALAASPRARESLRGAVVQLRRAVGAAHPDAATVRAAAERGVAGPGSEIPQSSRLQEAFGHHDLSAVRAHVGGEAARAAAAMGAAAYATGEDVAFASPPDLHTAAHEAAHVVQQRSGATLTDGVGAAGDRYEQHADAVADRVVRGESVAALLDAHGGGAPTAGSAVQRQVQRQAADDAQIDSTTHVLDVDENVCSEAQGLYQVDAEWVVERARLIREAVAPWAQARLQNPIDFSGMDEAERLIDETLRATPPSELQVSTVPPVVDDTRPERYAPPSSGGLIMAHVVRNAPRMMMALRDALGGQTLGLLQDFEAVLGAEDIGRRGGAASGLMYRMGFTPEEAPPNVYELALVFDGAQTENRSVNSPVTAQDLESGTHRVVQYGVRLAGYEVRYSGPRGEWTTAIACAVGTMGLEAELELADRLPNDLNFHMPQVVGRATSPMYYPPTFFDGWMGAYGAQAQAQALGMVECGAQAFNIHNDGRTLAFVSEGFSCSTGPRSIGDNNETARVGYGVEGGACHGTGVLVREPPPDVKPVPERPREGLWWPFIQTQIGFRTAEDGSEEMDADDLAALGEAAVYLSESVDAADHLRSERGGGLRFRARVYGLASTRWEGAQSEEEAYQRNMELSRARAENVRFELLSMLVEEGLDVTLEVEDAIEPLAVGDIVHQQQLQAGAGRRPTDRNDPLFRSVLVNVEYFICGY